jgi:hypothetical protein
MTNPSEGEATWVEGELEAIEVPMSSISRDELEVAMPTYSIEVGDIPLTAEEFIRAVDAYAELDRTDQELMRARFGLLHPELGGNISLIGEKFGIAAAEVRQRLLTAWRATHSEPPPNSLIL